MPARVVVLVSGSGTLLQALLDEAALRPEVCAYDVVGVVSDRADAYGLVRAELAHVPAVVVPPAEHADRATWDEALALAIGAFAADWVVCAGFMRILGPAVLRDFPGRIINTHPALLPSFPGAHGVRDALAYGVKVAGCTVHLVDAGVDTGPILAQESLNVLPGETEQHLHERIKEIERRLLVDVVAKVSTTGCTVDGRKVTIP